MSTAHDTRVRVLTEPELRDCAGVSFDALAAVTEAFRWHHQGRVEMPPIMHIALTDRRGDVDIKSAYVRGLDAFAVKIASGFYGNEALGLPFGGGLMAVFSAETGFCRALLLDNAYLTDLRTGLAGAVAAHALAPEAMHTVGVIGTGTQARWQLQCLKLVREFERVVVWGRRPDRVRTYVEDMRRTMDVKFDVAADAEQVARECEVLITTTAATAPLVQAGWLHPGMHLTAVGADMRGKQELDAEVLRRADRLVCDSIDQCLIGGELQHVARNREEAVHLGAIELGSIVDGANPGRQHADDLTLCDLTGMGVQDTAIAIHAMQAADRLGLGAYI